MLAILLQADTANQRAAGVEGVDALLQARAATRPHSANGFPQLRSRVAFAFAPPRMDSPNVARVAFTRRTHSANGSSNGARVAFANSAN